MKKAAALLMLDKHLEPIGYQRIWKDYYAIDLEGGNRGIIALIISSRFGDISISPSIEFHSNVFYDVDKAMGVLYKPYYGLVVSSMMTNILSALSKESSVIKTRIQEINSGRYMSQYSSGEAYFSTEREHSYDLECSSLASEIGEFMPIFYDRCCDWGFLSDLIMRNSWHLPFQDWGCFYRKTILLCLRGDRAGGFELLEREYKMITEKYPSYPPVLSFYAAFKKLDWDRFVLPPEMINPPAPKNSSLLDNFFSK